MDWPAYDRLSGDVIRWEAYTALLTELSRQRTDMRLALANAIRDGEGELSAALSALRHFKDSYAEDEVGWLCGDVERCG